MRLEVPAGDDGSIPCRFMIMIEDSRGSMMCGATRWWAFHVVILVVGIDRSRGCGSDYLLDDVNIVEHIIDGDISELWGG